MSDLNKCNFCYLNVMKKEAKDRGVELIIGKDKYGWVTATYSDRENPSAYFPIVSSYCVC